MFGNIAHLLQFILAFLINERMLNDNLLPEFRRLFRQLQKIKFIIREFNIHPYMHLYKYRHAYCTAHTHEIFCQVLCYLLCFTFCYISYFFMFCVLNFVIYYVLCSMFCVECLFFEQKYRNYRTYRNFNIEIIFRKRLILIE